MRDLNKYTLKCKRELDALKIKYAENIEFRINTRAKSRLGQCRKKGGSYIIEISSLLLDERVSEQLLIDGLMHELLHTCYGCMNHGERWKSLADRVNKAYGYNVIRAADENILPSELLPKPKYILKCVDCGTEIKRQKRSALVNNPSGYRCGKCGGKIKLIHADN